MRLGSGRFARVRFGCLAAALFAMAIAAQGQRLGNDVRPEHYSIALTPDLKAATFRGTESVEVQIATATRTITLNAAEITFDTVKVRAAGKEQAATVSLDADKQQATFTLPDAVPAGAATIEIAFTGKLNDQLRGFYLSKTKRRNYAVTQFEPTDARRAFPCFDEPAMKAKFDVSLTVDEGDTAISNGAIVSDTPGPGVGKHTLKFETTPRMSTYLVAFLVGDFKCTSGEQDKVALRVCATPDKVALTPYGLDVEKYVLHFYNSYFGIPYPLKKLDLIALPDFEAGAMENFGAITYREDALLLDAKTASVGSKKEVAEVIAHEMAHQWFGDLVTMAWWDNLWLNEGFATWMSSKPVAAMHPDWHMDQTRIRSLNGTLNLDAAPTTRPIRARADTPDEINQLFDGIAYGKAAAVLLMVENYVGEDAFRQGVHDYLSAHAYGNATAEDFWSAQNAATHKPVGRIMESLVTQPGVPGLTFSDPADGTVQVTQRRFFLSPGAPRDTSEKWTLPVCFLAGQSGRTCELLEPNTSSLPVPAAKLFFPDAGGTGYYRAAYGEKSHQALIANVETVLTPVERIRVLGDDLAQVRAGAVRVGDYLNLSGAVAGDPNADVIGASFDGIATIYVRLGATREEREGLARWIRATYGSKLAQVGEPSATDSDEKREMRARLFGVLGVYGKAPKVLTEARAIAEKYLSDPASVDTTLAQGALAVAARNGDAALFDGFRNQYETSTNPDIRDEALRLLAEFEQPALVERALEYAVSDKVRSQDAAIQIAVEMQSSATRDVAWKFVKANWDRIRTKLSPEMGQILVQGTGSFCSTDAAEDVGNFFREHKVAAADVSVRHAVEQINSCVEFRKAQEGNLQQWLASQH